ARRRVPPDRAAAGGRHAGRRADDAPGRHEPAAARRRRRRAAAARRLPGGGAERRARAVPGAAGDRVSASSATSGSPDSLRALGALLERGEASALELADDRLARIAASDLNAFIDRQPELTRAQAREADARRSRGE